MGNTLVVTKEDLIADDQYVVLAANLGALYYLELMERLRETAYYKQKLKYGCNLVHDELQKIISKDNDLFLGINDKLVYKLQDSQQEHMALIAGLRPEYIGVVNEIIKKLCENPMDVLAYFKLQMTDNS